MNRKQVLGAIIRGELLGLLGYLGSIGAVGLICYLNRLSLHFLADYVQLTWIPVTGGLGVHVSWQLARYHQLMSALTRKQTTRLPAQTLLTGAYARALAASWQSHRVSQATAQARLDQQRDYLVLWSHELKTPLTTLSLLAQQADLVPAEKIAPVVITLQAQVSMLLNLERADQIEHDLHLAPLDLTQLVKDCLREQRTWFTSRHLQLQVTLAAAPVVSDAKWLTVVVEQLLINAAKYARPAGRVTVRVRPHQLTIFNQGPPIDARNLPRIFEPGFTGRPAEAQATEATGMGLYLVKLVVDALGGQVEITNVSDGVQAQVSLPTATNI